MSSLAFNQLREAILQLPSEAKQTVKSALELKEEERQRLLEELSAPPKPLREVKVRRTVAKDFSREHTWISQNAHLYPGQHLAVSGDQLLAHGRSFGDVFDAAKIIKEDFLMHYSPAEDDPWAGVNWL
ncbi:MAG TPA: DUF5678 domain-containing protein [Blastocatellia bacterium]|nr:DUF5678 domain-containing protein [Blastocatellia bacterium]HMV84357.1 DUF5678 domain-containing protein [Blastocatellia bacterium]HMY72389.1 DUF5678 domain-containing protein [Blastocatellia bacterium]HMZ18306.1 DUF5678 domain-containing protein [Blastocatellia bacterium]HNG30654.1 DUF5678 domain-containing protein [Blastocatellia bacterium]